MEPSVRAFVVLVGILFSVGVGEAIGSAIGRTIAARLGQGAFGKLDRVLGAFVGAAQALLIIWLTGGLLAAGPSPTLATQAQKSFVLRALTGVLPAPTEIAGELARLLNDTALPDLFVGLEPIPGSARRPARRSPGSATRPRRHPERRQGDRVHVRCHVARHWFRRRPRLCRDECPRRRRRAHDPCRGRGPALRHDPGLLRSEARRRPALLVPAQGAGSSAVADRPRARSDRRDVRISRAEAASTSSPPRSPGRTKQPGGTSTARRGSRGRSWRSGR